MTQQDTLGLGALVPRVIGMSHTPAARTPRAAAMNPLGSGTSWRAAYSARDQPIPMHAVGHLPLMLSSEARLLARAKRTRVLGADEHTRPEPDPVRRASGKRLPDERTTEVRARIGLALRDDEVVADPEVTKPASARTAGARSRP